MHPDEASTTVVNASVVADYPTTAANVFFLEDEKKADIARAKKLARKTQHIEIIKIYGECKGMGSRWYKSWKSYIPRLSK